MKITRPCLAAFLSACVAACTPGAPPDPCRLTYIGEAPLQHVGYRLIVPAQINGHSMPLVLDTGGGPSLISSAHADLLKLRPAALPANAPPVMILGMGGNRPARVMLADSMRLGSLRAGQMPFLVPYDFLARRPGEELETLGTDALAGFDVDLDTVGGRLVFYRTSQFCESTKVHLSLPFFPAVAILDHIDSRPIVTASVRGQQFRALLDTGAPQSILFRNAAERLGLDAATLGKEPRAILRGTGPQTVDATRHLSEPIQLGGLKILQIHLNVSPETQPLADMVLGMDFLSKVHLWISNSSHAVVVQFPPFASPRT